MKLLRYAQSKWPYDRTGQHGPTWQLSYEDTPALGTYNAFGIEKLLVIALGFSRRNWKLIWSFGKKHDYIYILFIADIQRDFSLHSWNNSNINKSLFYCSPTQPALFESSRKAELFIFHLFIYLLFILFIFIYLFIYLFFLFVCLFVLFICFCFILFYFKNSPWGRWAYNRTLGPSLSKSAS